MGKPTLIFLQVLGGLTLLPFPFVAMVCIMSAPKANVPLAIPYFLVLLYPIVWIALWVGSWIAWKHGAVEKAILLSVTPLVLSVVLGVLYFLVVRKS